MFGIMKGETRQIKYKVNENREQNLKILQKLEAKFINFMEKREMCNMHQWLRGMDQQNRQTH